MWASQFAHALKNVSDLFKAQEFVLVLYENVPIPCFIYFAAHQIIDCKIIASFKNK